MKTIWTFNKMNYDANYFTYELFESKEDAISLMNRTKDAMLKAYDLELYYGNDYRIDLCSKDKEEIIVSMWVKEDVIH